ncbi:hypothetical protein G3M48_004446 [Beauveria asiatica]|uniref:Uncharacterized protein n=1 Tax=Beauveria asiatica TaxID=1069075 RepID=A0AAW0RT43_9HYPO
MKFSQKSKDFERDVLSCLDNAERSRTAIQNFPRVTKLRYFTNGYLSPANLNVISFTALPYHLPWKALRRLSDSGIPTSVKEKLDSLQLYKYWGECHLHLHKTERRLASRYLRDVYDYLYPSDDEATNRQLEDARCHGKAVMVSLERAPSVLQSFLFAGLISSKKRLLETTSSCTLAMAMYLAAAEGKDYRLELWLCSSMGDILSNALNNPTPSLRYLLGDMIFDAIESSQVMLEERQKERVCGTDALQLTRDGEDYKISISLGFEKGMMMYFSLFLD